MTRTRRILPKISTINEDIKMTTPQKNPYKLCKLTPKNLDMSKRWVIEYYIWDEQNEKLVRKRIIINSETKSQRLKEAKRITKEIDTLLQNGGVLNPISKSNTSETLNVNSNEVFVNDSSSIQSAAMYFIDFQKTILKPRTFETYKTDINRFLNYLKIVESLNMPLKNFWDGMAMDFLDYLLIDLKLSNRSRNNVKGTLSTFFNFFVKRKLSENNPFAGIQKITQVASKHTAFSEKQVQAIKKLCKDDPQLWLYINFMYYCFIRPRSELRLLKIGDIKEKTIVIRAENAKDNTTEHVMIPDALEVLIKKHKLRSYNETYFVFSENSKPGKINLGRDFFYNKHRRILEKLELQGNNYDMYSWKHTGVIALFQATQNIELVRQQCRHSDIATTQKYLRDLGQFVDYDQINKFPVI